MPTSAVAGMLTATMLGPWPGTDPLEATKVSLGLLPEPHLPGLPALPERGVGSDALGRTAALLVELPVDVQPHGWRFVDRPGLDQRRASSALSTDINVLADAVGASGHVPAEFKAHLMGPLSMAAGIHLHNGERAVQDHGARRDIAQSLAAGLGAYSEKLAAAVPGARLTLQIDEPHVAPALAGSIPTASGYRTLRSVPSHELRSMWCDFVAAARSAGFDSVAINLARQPLGAVAGTPDDAADKANAASWRKALELSLESGIDAVALPIDGLDTGHWEQLAGALESGTSLWAGTVPAGFTQAPGSNSALTERILRPWRGLGLETLLLDRLRITPAGELAQLTPAQARRTVSQALEVADALTQLRNG